jgi:hypothetical protein
VTTSIELDPVLLRAAKIVAATEGIRLRELIEEALNERLARTGGHAMTTRRARRGRTP